MLTPEEWNRYERALAILHCFSLQRSSWWRQWLFGRWAYPDEPLRHDAGNLVNEAGIQFLQPHHTENCAGLAALKEEE